MAMSAHWLVHCQPSITQQGKLGFVAAVQPPCVCSVLHALICLAAPFPDCSSKIFSIERKVPQRNEVVGTWGARVCAVGCGSQRKKKIPS